MNPRKKVKLNHHQGNEPPDIFFEDDPPYSFYALVLSIDDLGDTHKYIMLEAAYVGWYQQLNLQQLPNLNGVAIGSGVRLLELIQTNTDFDNLNLYLQQTTGYQFEESSWWMLTQSFYNLRAAVRMEQFLPPLFQQDPSAVGWSNSRHEDFFVLPRLIVPRNQFRQWLFSARERF